MASLAFNTYLRYEVRDGGVIKKPAFEMNSSWTSHLGKSALHLTTGAQLEHALLGGAAVGIPYEFS
jgi:hypothetical protein